MHRHARMLQGTASTEASMSSHITAHSRAHSFTLKTQLTLVVAAVQGLPNALPEVPLAEGHELG